VSSGDAPLVVLLHGLARREGSMAALARALEAAGFATWAKTYPSRRMSIADAARTVADWIADAAAGRPLYAVTHSLGGVLVRHMADPRLDWRRIVMLAPPSQGSTLAAAMGDNPLYRWFYGPAGQELRDGSAWPAPPAPFAVIAGTRRRQLTNPTSWTVARRFPPDRDHDGTVAVDETRLPGMADYAEVDATHTWIMNHPDAQARVLAFLRDGRF
jgi:hypothetical protein